jgi:hypothetical protein
MTGYSNTAKSGRPLTLSKSGAGFSFGVIKERGGQGGDMAAGGAAKNPDAVGLQAIVGGVSAHDADCPEHVEQRTGRTVVPKTVSQVENRDAEMIEPRFQLAFLGINGKPHVAATWAKNDRRSATGARRGEIGLELGISHVIHVMVGRDVFGRPIRTTPGHALRPKFNRASGNRGIAWGAEGGAEAQRQKPKTEQSDRRGHGGESGNPAAPAGFLSRYVAGRGQKLLGYF